MTTTTKLWRVLARRFAHTAGTRRPRHSCSIKAPHDGPLVAVAGDGSDATMLCVRHALAWAESDLCRDWAAHNSGVSRGALSTWIAEAST